MEIKENEIYQNKITGYYVHVKEVTRYNGNIPKICHIVTSGDCKFKKASTTTITRKVFTLNKFEEKYKKIEEEKVDFSKFIGRIGSVLIIKSKKDLFVHNNKDISYSNECEYFTDELHYVEFEMKDLKPGDVFFEGSLTDAKKEQKLHNFHVLVGIDDDEDIVTQHLYNDCGVERITDTNFSRDCKNQTVVKFLRE